jgi:hypothetical protein
MVFSGFTLGEVERRLGITVQEADLFPRLVPAPVPNWRRGLLRRGTRPQNRA